MLDQLIDLGVGDRTEHHRLSDGEGWCSPDAKCFGRATADRETLCNRAAIHFVPNRFRVEPGVDCRLEKGLSLIHI